MRATSCVNAKQTRWSGGSDIISLLRFVLRPRGLCYRAE
jgi:hypothetical protein